MAKTIFFRKKTHFFCGKVWRFKNKSYLCIAIEKQTSVIRTQGVQNPGPFVYRLGREIFIL